MADREEVHARHILLKTKEQAIKVIALLDKGVEFEKLARTKSVGPSGASGGDLGFFGRGQMVPAFEKAVFNLEPGVYTTYPVETQFGWHVILSEGKRIMGPISFEKSEEKIRNQLTQEVVSNFLEDLRRAAKIKRYNFDGTKIDRKAK